MYTYFTSVKKTLIFDFSKFLVQIMIENQTFYKNTDKHLIAVDCIIFGFDKEQLKLLLFKRKVAPFQHQWSLIGSFVKKDEDVSKAAQRVLKEGTGLENVYMKVSDCYGDTGRDTGARVISIAHYSLIRLNETNETSVNVYQAQWFNVDEIPTLILDHNQMVKDALIKLRRKAKYQPIGFELLPKKFTIPQLKALYDAIHQKTLDRRNFRKRILSMDILKKLDEKDKQSSRKGAFLYQFDKMAYEKLMEKGFHFEL